MKMIVGLGNPGAKYAQHRHNIGFMAADEIARRHDFSPFGKKFSGEVAEGRIAGEKCLIIKPLTYMNLSGQSVGEAARFYKIEPQDIIVIHDELDLAPGKVRVKIGGGHGGHNGLKSIDAHLSTKDYQRLRLGIGHPGDKARVNGHVLGDFAKSDQEWLTPLLEDIGRYIDLLITGDGSGFLNKISLGAGEKPAPQKKPKAQSHIRQARSTNNQAPAPTKGPMAEMLKKLLGGNKD